MKTLLRFLRDNFVYQLDLERKSILTAGLWGGYALCRHGFDSSPALRTLNATAARIGLSGELLFGGLLVIGAALQMVGLIRQNDRLRMVAAMLLCAVWLIIGGHFFLYNERGMGLPTYLAFAYTVGVLYFQIGTDRR